ncbi:Copine-8 [Mizuhopecten yessoensis]|uniref:Copine-8 n=1 Tax=Mizuhopecten yessoensis TaxID=6573 RepID=A0A210R4I0_MIZYE|nr:Copine-8 [Mizuhopecten yessoensis]
MAAYPAAQGNFQAGTAVVPASQVEITVSCRGLKDADVFSKSDPMCVLSSKDMKTGSYYEVGRTEMIKDTLDPDFVKKFTMQYFFEESQKLKFEIYDVDSNTARLDAHDFLGRFEGSLGEIVGSPGGKVEKPLTIQNYQKGRIIIRAEEMSNCKEVVTLQFKGIHLDKKDFFGKSDPYLVFYRANEDNSYTIVHKTEVIKNTLNPTWRPFTVQARALCNGDYDRSIKVECYDWDSDGSHDFIGEFTTNMRELSRGAGSNNQFSVINPKKKAKKKKYTNSGEAILMSYTMEIQHSFLDYIQNGTEMSFTVAVDFTASNGNPSSPTSLHYLNPYGAPNQYAAAIQAVGEIIQDYDSDKLFPALGFGARMSDGSVHHEFALNFNPSNPFCQGVQGILQAYFNSLKNVQLYGPTNFAPVINHVARFATAVQDGSNYFVLLIITDGVITDMPQTMQAIIIHRLFVLSLPLETCTILTIDPLCFLAMDTLDGDDVRLSYNGKQAVRDIVQFVPFRDFLRGANGSNMQMCQAALAKEVLAEIPEQFLSYMKAHNFKPKPPASAPGSY